MSEQSTETQGLAFQDIESCRKWLDTQPLASTVQMQSVLQRQIGLLNRTEMSGADRLSILETLREQIYRTQEECQARFARRPVPLAIPEQAAFDASQATWQSLADGYVRCLENLLTGEVALQSREALIVERIMVTFVDKQIDMYHGSQMPHPSHWLGLNQCLAAAQELGVLESPVKDRLRNTEQSITPLSAYVESMLLHMAAPTETNARQLAWLTYWARRWARKVTLLVEVPAKPQAAPIYVALDKDAPGSHGLPKGSNAVCVFDTSELRLSLKRRLSLLNKGEAPSTLQMGENCTMPAAGVLLEKTYQRWCKNQGRPRRHERRDQQGECHLLCGFEKVMTLFAPSMDAVDDVPDLARLRRERAQMMIFGQAGEDVPMVEPAAKQNQTLAAAEAWQVLDQSASGLRLLRPYARGQQRIAIGMLMAVGFAGEQTDVVLASVRWTLVRADGSIEIGLQLMPGHPHMIGLTVKLPSSSSPQRARGLLMPAIPALKESSSLLVPHGWFEAGRVVEMHEGKRHQVRLGQPLERGRDFDRVTFSEVGAQVAA